MFSGVFCVTVCIYSFVFESRSVVLTLCNSMDYSPWNSEGQNIGMGSLSLLQGIFPTWGSNPSLPHCGWILYQLSHKGNPRILEWVAYPFSCGSSPPRNRTKVSGIAGGFYTNWAMREASFVSKCCIIFLCVSPSWFTHLRPLVETVCSSLSRVQLFATPWIIIHQAPLSLGFSRQEYWSGLPFPSPGDLPDLGIEPGSPALQADSLPSEPPGKPPVAVETMVASNPGTSVSTADGPGWEFLWDTNSREQWLSHKADTWNKYHQKVSKAALVYTTRNCSHFTGSWVWKTFRLSKFTQAEKVNWDVKYPNPGLLTPKPFHFPGHHSVSLWIIILNT